MKLNYILLRLLRHFMSEGIARFLLKKRWIIKPGLESSNPTAAVEQYIHTLTASGKSVQNSRVLVFGYGGRFAVGMELLKRGAAHVVLCDHFVLLDEERNLELLPTYEEFLTLENGLVRPRSDRITLLHGDIRESQIQSQIKQVDFILSTSVYEHLDDVDGITRALAKLTAPNGVNLHFVDLRDHYFKYPFEMLRYSASVWKNFLNPTSNLNRFRLSDYQKVFNAYFEKNQFTVISREEHEFEKIKNKIRPEFKTGDLAVDSIALIYVLCEKPHD